jgi:aerobic carbon-monoxide dehydrogenase medium subunit
MKPVAFDYARPASVPEAIALLFENPDAKVLAGGQTLGPMLNLRLAQPPVLVDITRIADLAAARTEPDAIVLGATITHASIEDGRVPDPTHGFLSRVARGIAYRAVRSRGTIGGSLAHADPAADWLACLTALGADLEVTGPAGIHVRPIAGFVRGAMQADLGPGEIVTGIRIPKFSSRARFGYHKICRKTGEFAEAIGVAVYDPDREVFRLVASTATGAPIALEDKAFSADATALRHRLNEAGPGADTYEVNVRIAALQWAMREARAA